MKAPTETKKIEQTSGLQEPWRTLSQVVYYESKAGAEGFHDENAPPPVNENFGVCKPCAVDAKTASFMASRRMLDLAGVQVRQHAPQQSM